MSKPDLASGTFSGRTSQVPNTLLSTPTTLSSPYFSLSHSRHPSLLYLGRQSSHASTTIMINRGQIAESGNQINEACVTSTSPHILTGATTGFFILLKCTMRPLRSCPTSHEYSGYLLYLKVPYFIYEDEGQKSLR